MAELSALTKHIINDCPNLTFMGIMTIGRFGYDITNGPNPDFICLSKCREAICNELEINIKNVELSMGMSNDYEHAVGLQFRSTHFMLFYQIFINCYFLQIELGSTNVRVGSAIFGNRPSKNT